MERFRDAGYLTKDLAARVLRLLAAPAVPSTERDQRRWLHALGPLWPAAVAKAGATAALGEELDRWRERLAAIKALLLRDGRRILEPEKLLTGEEVQRLLGIPQGPELGQALDRIRQAQVDGRIATKEEALAHLRSGTASTGQK
ncbi:MAG TPA: hypothetical protein VHQ65_01755 [Thermoanaerobaculia bacterium]|nr:hypothetical protein [Thermoanaerobaculia bacterium]